MTNTIEIFVPELPPGLNGKNGLIRLHWAARKKLQNRWNEYIFAKVAHLKRKCPAPPLKLTYTRLYASVPMDLDNLAASVKIPLDALRKSGIIPEDDPTIIASYDSRQRKVPRMIDRGIFIKLETHIPETL